ncbi:MAG: lipoyl(octanoyl) transferase LipB [Candidatus Omnitrophica bacterium]|nr:lipoyl(octanoyl) transferase LipB [Candidatus Omnitrophota bacterium]
MARERHFPIPVHRWDAAVPYEEAARRQEESAAEGREALILCEHAPTITLGTSAGPGDLAFSSLYYERMGVTVLKSPRGGKATYHGPGQLVGYPILNLRQRGMTVHGYMRFLESLMIRLCAEYGVQARRIDGKAGCWIGEKKIGFIGVRVRRGFCFHGFSLNITPQREAFRLIVPCGMPDLHVTSLQEELHDSAPDLRQAADRMEELFFELLAGVDSIRKTA